MCKWNTLTWKKDYGLIQHGTYLQTKNLGHLYRPPPMMRTKELETFDVTQMMSTELDTIDAIIEYADRVEFRLFPLVVIQI